MVQEQLKGVLTSKVNIFFFCLSLMPQLAGWKDFFIKYGENLDIIFLALISMLVLFGIYQYNQCRDKRKKSDTFLALKENIKELNEETSNDSSEFKKQENRNSGLNYKKILVGISIMLFVFSLSFIFFLKDAPVYYVKVSENLNSTEAVARKQVLRENFLENGRNEFVPTIRRRSIRDQKNNYFLSINGAFLDKRKAEIQLEEIRNILKDNRSIKLIESKNAHITRKIEYLVAHFVPYRILALF